MVAGTQGTSSGFVKTGPGKRYFKALFYRYAPGIGCFRCSIGQMVFVMHLARRRIPPAPPVPGTEPKPKPDPEPQPGSEPDVFPPVNPEPEPGSTPDVVPEPEPEPM